MNAKLALICCAVLFLASCRTAPIRNIPDMAVVTASGKPVTEEQVRSAIIRAGSGLGWMMTPGPPGLITGRLALRGHIAVIDVKYTDKTYSITYKDSTDLEYDGRHIHKNYNGWIENLDRDIRATLYSS